MSKFNTVCLTVCVTMIALVLLLGLAMIWLPVDEAVCWKAIISLVLVLVASASAGGVVQYFERGRKQ